MIRIEDVIEKVEKNRPEPDIELIRRAYLFSALHHRGQKRASGEPILSIRSKSRIYWPKCVSMK